MRRSLPALVVLATLLAGCGIDTDVVAREAAEAAPPPDTEGGSSTTTEPEPEPAAPASPFVLDEPPEGHLVRLEGEGEADPDDAHLPVIVLAPDGETDGAGVVFVEATADDGDEEYVEATDDEPWASLTVDGLRVWGIDATEDELGDIAAAATAPAAPGLAPTVEDPPGDLEVVGSISLDGVLGLVAPVPEDTDDAVPGPATAHAAVYVCDDCDSTVVVMTLPAGALDPAAVVTETRAPRNQAGAPRDSVAEEIDDDDLDGVLVTTADPTTGQVVRRTLVVETTWGDILLVVARGADGLDGDELVELAGEVERDEG